MKASKFTDAQKAFILKPGEAVCPLLISAPRLGSARRHTSTGRTSMPECFCREMKRLKLLEDENSRLKRIVADLSLDKEMPQDVLRRKL